MHATKRSSSEPGTAAGSSTSPRNKKAKLETAANLQQNVSPHAEKLNGPLLEQQNNNLAIELASAKREINNLESRRSVLEAQQSDIANYLSLVDRSWTELDCDLSTVFGTSGDAVGPQTGDQSLFSLVAPTIRLSRIISSSGSDSDGDSDGDDDDDDDATQRSEAAAAQNSVGTHGQVQAAVKKHMASRIKFSKQLAQLAVKNSSSGVSSEAIQKFSRVKRVKAKLSALEDKLESMKQERDELKQQLVLCKFQRDRARSKLSVLSTSQTSPSPTTTSSAGSGAVLAAAPQSPSTGAAEGVETSEEGRKRAEEAKLEIRRLEAEIQRITNDFDAQMTKHAGRITDLSEKLARCEAKRAAAEAQCHTLQDQAKRSSNGPQEVVRLKQEVHHLEAELADHCNKHREQVNHLQQKLALQTALFKKTMRDLEGSNAEKVSIKERYQRKVHQLETEFYALRQTLKLKDAQATALSAELAVSKGVQTQLDIANAKLERSAKLHAGQLQQASQAQAAKIDELTHRLRIAEEAAKATAVPADAQDLHAKAAVSTKLEEELKKTQAQLRATRQQYHEAAVLDSLYAEIDRINEAFRTTKAQVSKLTGSLSVCTCAGMSRPSCVFPLRCTGKLEERAADCLKYSSAKTKSDRICMHLKSEKLAHRAETAAANTLQKQYTDKIRNLEEQVS